MTWRLAFRICLGIAAVAILVGCVIGMLMPEADAADNAIKSIRRTISVLSWQDSGSSELVRVNETDKVVTITEAGIAAGWTVATPPPTSIPTTSSFRFNNGIYTPIAPTDRDPLATWRRSASTGPARTPTRWSSRTIAGRP